jgi:hypothetical protein
MNDATAIFLILGVIYLLDCLHLLHRNSVVFSTWIKKECKAAFAGTVFGTRSSGVFISPLLPPLGLTFVAQPLPVSFSPAGVCSFITPALTSAGRPPQVERVVRYDEVKRLSREMKDVLINGELFVKCRSPRIAHHVAEAIRRLVKAEPGDRERLIQALAVDTFDVDAVRVAVGEFRASTKALRLLCNVHWVYMFIVNPVVILWLGFWGWVLPLVAGLLVLHVVVIGEYWRTHKKLMAAESYHRWEGVVKMVLCPPASARALDLVSLDLLDLYHPLAVAAAIAGKEELQRVSVLMMREARYALPIHSPVEGVGEIAEWHRRTMGEAAETFLRKEQVDLSGVDRAPERWDDRTKSYCPRCLTAYTLEAGECSDCRGLALVRWGKGGQ